jgi:hypothetical protein
VLIFGPDAIPLFIFEGENHVQHLDAFLTLLLNHYKSSVRATPTRKTSPEDFTAAADNDDASKQY